MPKRKETSYTMERKGFLTAAIGVASAVVAGGLAASAAPSVVPPPTMAPRPGATRTPWERGQKVSDRNIHRIRRHLDKVIDELSHDQHDYGGHREHALDLCRQAREQLLDAEQYDSNHPNG